VLELLRGINRQFGLSIVLITHEMNVARQIADQVLVLANGHIVEDGTTQSIFKNPRSEEARLMLRAAGFLPEDDNVRLSV
jgi:D-methionine transport system ATP-binding protein